MRMDLLRSAPGDTFVWDLTEAFRPPVSVIPSEEVALLEH
jgi:hypothetical protein